MAYHEQLADRIREAIRQGLMCRVDRAIYDSALERNGCRPMTPGES